MGRGIHKHLQSLFRLYKELGLLRRTKNSQTFAASNDAAWDLNPLRQIIFYFIFIALFYLYHLVFNHQLYYRFLYYWRLHLIKNFVFVVFGTTHGFSVRSNLETVKPLPYVMY